MGNHHSKGKYRLLLLGLDSAGKTTMLQRLSKTQIRSGPTIGYNVVTVKRKGKQFIIWDVGGQERQRLFWRHYYHGVSVIIFQQDSTDEQRLDIAREEQQSQLCEEELKYIPQLIVCNKQDMKEALNCEILGKYLQIDSIKDRKFTILPISALSNTGIDACVDWIVKCGTSLDDVDSLADIAKKRIMYMDKQSKETYTENETPDTSEDLDTNLQILSDDKDDKSSIK